MGKYFIVYNPATYELMNIDRDKCTSPLGLITSLTNRDASHLNQENYLDFLYFDLHKRRVGMVETFGIENGAAIYIGNQIARLAPDTQVIQADDNRAALREAIERRGQSLPSVHDLYQLKLSGRCCGSYRSQPCPYSGGAGRDSCFHIPTGCRSVYTCLLPLSRAGHSGTGAR